MRYQSHCETFVLWLNIRMENPVASKCVIPPEITCLKLSITNCRKDRLGLSLYQDRYSAVKYTMGRIPCAIFDAIDPITLQLVHLGGENRSSSVLRLTIARMRKKEVRHEKNTTACFTCRLWTLSFCEYVLCDFSSSSGARNGGVGVVGWEHNPWYQRDTIWRPVSGPATGAFGNQYTQQNIVVTPHKIVAFVLLLSWLVSYHIAIYWRRMNSNQ